MPDVRDGYQRHRSCPVGEAVTDPILAELRLLRLMSGQRAIDVAAAAGLDPSSISYWENGRKSPHLDHLRRYMDVLGFDLAVVPKDPS